MTTRRRGSWSRRFMACLLGIVFVAAGASSTWMGTADAAVPGTPGAPTVTSVTGGVRAVTVSFKKPTHDGGYRITSYRARCTSSNGGLPASRQGFNTPITVTALTSSKTYTCTVSAINKVAIGPASAPSGPVITLPRPPDAPKITKMTPGFHAVTVSFAAGNTGGAPITNYRVTCTSEYGTRSHQGFSSPITIACVAGAEEYTCNVAAENRVGWSHSSGNSAETSSLPIKPGAPTITSVIGGVRAVTLAVSKPVNDGGVRVTGYRATCVSSNGGVTGIHQSFKSPVTVAGLSATKTYTCTVAAVNRVSTGAPSAPTAPIVPGTG
jgi:hypothetical protein